MQIRTNRHDDGFSLLEFAIVLTMLGLFVGSAIALYSQYRTRLLMERNANAALVMKGAIDSYFVKNRHYPCPAPLSAKRGDANYGIAMDCTDTTPGDYNLNTRSVDLDYDGTAETVRIREGTFPFRTVMDFMADNKIIDRSKPGEADILDAYGRQFTYVVTENQATGEYADNAGAIRILDEHNRTVSDRGNFLLISHGEDGVGARYPDGTIRNPCTGSGKDVENCNNTSGNDYTYMYALQSRDSGSNYFDDQIVFLQWFPYDLWEQTKANDNNIHNINPGNVGIGLKDPTEQLHIVGGDLLAYRFWEHDNPVNDIGKGKAMAQQICNSNGTDCFSPQLIAGDVFPQCTLGQVMYGIGNSQAKCKPAFVNFNQTCGAANTYAYRLIYDSTSQVLTVDCKDPTGGAS